MRNHGSDRSSNQHCNKSKYKYRVLVSRDGQSPEIVWFTSDRDYARSIAGQINQRLPSQPAWVEEWTRLTNRGDWRRLLEPVEPPAVAAAPTTNLPWRHFDKGTVFEATLLPVKTRRGGWRAKLLRYNATGPITNTDEVPLEVKPGDVVCLQLEASNCDGSHLQMRWIPQTERYMKY